MKQQPPRAEEEVQRAGMQMIGLFRLMAIAAGGMLPLLVVFFYLMKGMQAESREALIREMDGRYVNAAVDAVKMADHDSKINESIVSNRSQEVRIQSIEMKLEQIQRSLDHLSELIKQGAETQRQQRQSR